MKVSILQNEKSSIKQSPTLGQSLNKEMMRGNVSNYNRVNTQVGRENISGDCVSFKGTLGDKILKSPKTHAILMKGKHNPLLIEALFAILITCGLRPLTIMATAGQDEENKQKCKMQVAKSFSTGIVGFVTTLVITKPISEAIKKFAGPSSKNITLPADMQEQIETIIKPANEFLKKSAEQLKGYSVKNMQGNVIETTIENIVATKGAKESLKEFSSQIFDQVENAIVAQKGINKYRSSVCDLLNKVICPVFSPAKAAVTIALVPVILGLVFKKPKEEQKQNNENKIEQQNQPNFTKQFTNPASSIFTEFTQQGGKQ